MIVATIFPDRSDVLFCLFFLWDVQSHLNKIMFHRQTPDTHANSQCTPATAYASQEGPSPPVQTILPQGLPTLCLILQSMCANEGVREGIFYRSSAKVVVILSGVGLETESADPRSCIPNQATKTITELAKLEIRIFIWRHAKVCICKSEQVPSLTEVAVHNTPESEVLSAEIVFSQKEKIFIAAFTSSYLVTEHPKHNIYNHCIHSINWAVNRLDLLETCI